MKSPILKKYFIFICITSLYSFFTIPMEQHNNQKNHWLYAMRQEYKKLNYKQDMPLTPFMKEELGRIAYKLEIYPSELDNSIMFNAYVHLHTKKKLITPMLPALLCMFFPITPQSHPSELIDLLPLCIVFYFFVYLIKEAPKNYEEYGSLIFEEIKKEELNEEWWRERNEK